MTWTDLAANWNSHLRALAQRFPYADLATLSAIKDEPLEMSRALAKSHDLTLNEAHEELEHYLLVQQLAREASDFRTHDAA